MASECIAGTYYAPRVDARDDCGKAVIRGACALLFPKCDDDGAPLGTCESIWCVAAPACVV